MKRSSVKSYVKGNVCLSVSPWHVRIYRESVKLKDPASQESTVVLFGPREHWASLSWQIPYKINAFSMDQVPVFSCSRGLIEPFQASVCQRFGSDFIIADVVGCCFMNAQRYNAWLHGYKWRRASTMLWEETMASTNWYTHKLLKPVERWGPEGRTEKRKKWMNINEIGIRKK